MEGEEEGNGVPLTGKAVFDTDLYGGNERAGYRQTAIDDDDAEGADDQQDDM